MYAQCKYLVWKISHAHIKIREICLQNISHHHMKLACLRTDNLKTKVITCQSHWENPSSLSCSSIPYDTNCHACISLIKKHNAEVFIKFLVIQEQHLYRNSVNSRTAFFNSKLIFLDPFTPTSDQDRISLYNINTISSRQVMRIEKNINYGIISWSNTKFSELTS